MIKFSEFTPSIYYDKSRDFQLIGRLYDLVLNSLKTEADILYSLPFSDNSPDELLELLAYTFGLRLTKNKYTVAQLRAICSVAALLTKQKGTISAVDNLCRALLHADGISEDFLLTVIQESNKRELIISVPIKALSYDEILPELLDYILPAGYVFHVRRTDVQLNNIKTTTFIRDQVRYAIDTQQQSKLVKLESIAASDTMAEAKLAELTDLGGAKLAFSIPKNGSVTTYLGFCSTASLASSIE